MTRITIIWQMRGKRGEKRERQAIEIKIEIERDLGWVTEKIIIRGERGVSWGDE